MAPAHRHSGPVENLAGDEVMHCVLAPGEETSFRPRVSGDLKSAQGIQHSEDKHDSLRMGSPPLLTDRGLRADEVWKRFRGSA